ncbi:MAG TPA: hypothetical protein VG323_13045 [Thermoanaerobaculia bacterium]|nr:hypothetical protein [Thermoanaerobaculia bacterium]
MASQPYFEEIEAHFAARRQTPFILSAKDWALMKSWHDEGVPLPVVIEAIDAVFDKTEKKVNSLSYCRHAVKELWKQRKEMLVGAAGETPEAAPGPLLDALAMRLEAVPAAAAFAPRVRALASEKSVPRIEEKLMELERELLDHVIAAEDVAALRAEIATSLAGAKLDEKTRARTEEANLRRLVRERFALPRLTLFT